MSNVIFFFSILTILVNTFSIGLGFSKVNRTFLMLSNGIIENSVIIVEESSVPYDAYFDNSQIEEDTIKFLSNNLGKYLKTAKVSFYYFYPETLEICTLTYSKAVSISLYTKINYLVDYSKTLTFEIRSNANG